MSDEMAEIHRGHDEKGYWTPTPEERRQFAAWLRRKVLSWEGLRDEMHKIDMTELGEMLGEQTENLRWTASWLEETAAREDGEA